MSLGFPGQRGLHEVYTTGHDASVKRPTSYDILRVYVAHWRFILEARHSKGAFSVKGWAYCPASSVKEAATFSCLGPFFRLLRINCGC